MSAGLLLLLGVLIVLPVGVLVLGSLLSEPPRALHFDWSGLTLRNYAEVMTQGGFPSLLGTTVADALVTTVTQAFGNR